MSDVNLSSLLKKTSHYDKDERYMATSDLCEVLKRQAAAAANNNANLLDAATERQICTAVLRLLHDKSNDVQAIAVKTLSVLLTTVQQEQVGEIADSLADQVLDASKSELRDVYAIGLRTLIKTIPSNYGNSVSARLVTRLLDGCRVDKEDITLACLDALTDLLTRFGLSVSVVRQHDNIMQMCLKQLGSPHAVVRKRAGTTLGCLAIALSDTLLHRMVENILAQMETLIASSNSNSDTTRALIRTMCTVSGAVGHRLGQVQIDRILPIFLKFTSHSSAQGGSTGGGIISSSQDPDLSMTSQEDNSVAFNELRESCFMGFESFVLRCPKEVEPHLQNIVQASLVYMSYDPNYSYDDDDDDGASQNDNDDDDAPADDEPEDMEEEQEEDDEYEDEEEDEEDDDDDESWKVRRSAIRSLKAVVEAHRHDPTRLWKRGYPKTSTKTTTVAAALLGRFKEREENCRVGVIDCFTRLLAVTVQAPPGVLVLQRAAAGEDNAAADADALMSDNDDNVIPIRMYAPRLVLACQKILATKANERSKSAVMALLSTLCKAPGGLGGPAQIQKVFTHIKVFLQVDSSTSSNSDAVITTTTSTTAETTAAAGTHGGGSKALRLDALSLVHAILASDKHQAADVRKSLPLLLPPLCGAVKEQWYKVIAEALRAIAAVPKFYEGDREEECSSASSQQVAGQLYNAVMPLLAAHDVDQEIKECALKACASLLSSLHASLPTDKTTRMLELLLERLQNETTRLAAMKTLSQVATATKVDVSPILSESIATLAGFLKLASRSLKQSSLEALDVLIVYHGAHESLQGGELYSSVLQDCAPLIMDSDLHLSHLSLRTSVSILQVCPNAGPAIKAHALEPALILSTSSLLQDSALDSLLLFFRQMVVSNAIDFSDLRFLLNQRSNDNVGKHGVYNLAKCIAVVTVANEANSKIVLSELISLLEGSVTPSAESDTKMRQIHLALLITGDLGRLMDLATLDEGAPERLKKIYLSYFGSSSEDLKHAAAYALGNASVGSQATFLPAIVTKLDEDNKKMQYLLLSALREFIQCSFRQSGGAGITPSIPVIVPPLEKHCSDEEEGVRTMVAECMGSLTSLQPGVMLLKLDELQKGHSSINAPGGVIADDDVESKKNALVCWTVATSVKLAIAGKVDVTQLSQYMPSFVKLLEQKELNVRNSALLMIYSAVHHMPQVVASLLKDSVMPSLYEVSDLKLERKVDLGPFTHRVDDALPLRKAALSIFATCLENLPGSIDITAFMPVLAKALGDAEDIQLHAHQIIISMCLRHPTYLVASVDTFVEPLDKTLNKKPGQKTGTELERLNDWIKSALRVMMTLTKLDGVMNSRVFSDFVGRTNSNSRFAQMLETLGEET